MPGSAYFASKSTAPLSSRTTQPAVRRQQVDAREVDPDCGDRGDREALALGGTSARTTEPPRVTFVRHSSGAAIRSPPATTRTCDDHTRVAPAGADELLDQRPVALPPGAVRDQLEHPGEVLGRAAEEHVLAPAPEAGLDDDRGTEPREATRPARC